MAHGFSICRLLMFALVAFLRSLFLDFSFVGVCSFGNWLPIVLLLILIILMLRCTIFVRVDGKLLGSVLFSSLSLCHAVGCSVSASAVLRLRSRIFVWLVCDEAPRLNFPCGIGGIAFFMKSFSVFDSQRCSTWFLLLYFYIGFPTH